MKNKLKTIAEIYLHSVAHSLPDSFYEEIKEDGKSDEELKDIIINKANAYVNNYIQSGSPLNIDRNIINNLRKVYIPGTRVILVKMDDKYTSLEKGLEGTVTGVDDAATIHINWDDGHSLGAAYLQDIVELKTKNLRVLSDIGNVKILNVSASGVTNQKLKDLMDAFKKIKELKKRDFFAFENAIVLSAVFEEGPFIDDDIMFLIRDHYEKLLSLPYTNEGFIEFVNILYPTANALMKGDL